MDPNNPLLQRVIIDIDVDTGEYSADIQVCNRDAVVAALKDLATKLEGDSVYQQGLSVTDDGN